MSVPRRLVLTVATVSLALMAGWRPSPASAADAQVMYKKYCRGCHGEDGRGNGPGAKALKTPPGNFANCEKMAAYDRDWLIKIVTEGGPAVGRSAQMVGVGKKISAEEIEELVNYVLAFCKPD